MNNHKYGDEFQIVKNAQTQQNTASNQEYNLDVSAEEELDNEMLNLMETDNSSDHDGSPIRGNKTRAASEYCAYKKCSTNFSLVGWEF